VAKIFAPDGDEIPFVAALSQSNAITRVLPFEMGNQPRGHMVSVETYAPAPSTRIMNQGVLPTFGKSMQIVEQMSELPDVFEVDCSVAEAMGNPQAYRLRMVQSKIRALGRKFAFLVFYGNISSVPSDFNGLSMRYNSTSTSTSKTAQNVFSAAGSTGSGQCSIWFLGMGPMALTGIHPKFGAAGFQHTDWGKQVLPNAADVNGGTSARLEIYRDTFKWQGGIALVDWRHVMRICNIDTADINGATPTTDIQFYMENVLAAMPYATNEPAEVGVVQTTPNYWWMFNRTVRRGLGHQLKKVVIAGAGIRTDNVRETQEYYHKYEYAGYPVGIVDQLVTTEAVVS
jgi:hypothetical protein